MLRWRLAIAQHAATFPPLEGRNPRAIPTPDEGINKQDSMFDLDTILERAARPPEQEEFLTWDRGAAHIRLPSRREEEELAAANRLVSSLTRALAGTPSVSEQETEPNVPAATEAVAEAEEQDEYTSPLKDKDAEGRGEPGASQVLDASTADEGRPGNESGSLGLEEPRQQHEEEVAMEEEGIAEEGGGFAPGRFGAPLTQMPFSQGGPEEDSEEEEPEAGPALPQVKGRGPSWMSSVSTFLRKVVLPATQPAEGGTAPEESPAPGAQPATAAAPLPDGAADARPPKAARMGSIPATQVAESAEMQELARCHDAAQAFLAELHETPPAGAPAETPAAAQADEEMEEEAAEEGEEQEVGGAALAKAIAALVPAAAARADEVAAVAAAAAGECAAGDGAAGEQAGALCADDGVAAAEAAEPQGGQTAPAEESPTLGAVPVCPAAAAVFFTQAMDFMATQDDGVQPGGSFAFLARAPAAAAAPAEEAAAEPMETVPEAQDGAPDGEAPRGGAPGKRSFMEEITEPDLTEEMFAPDAKRARPAPGPADQPSAEEAEGVAAAPAGVPGAAGEAADSGPAPACLAAAGLELAQPFGQALVQALAPHRSRPVTRDSDIDGMLQLHRGISRKPTAIAGASRPPRPPPAAKKSAEKAEAQRAEGSPAKEAIAPPAPAEAAQTAPAAAELPAAAEEVPATHPIQNVIKARERIKDRMKRPRVAASLPQPQVQQQQLVQQHAPPPAPAVVVPQQLAPAVPRRLPPAMNPALAAHLVMPGQGSPAGASAAQAAVPVGYAQPTAMHVPPAAMVQPAPLGQARGAGQLQYAAAPQPQYPSVPLHRMPAAPTGLALAPELAAGQARVAQASLLVHQQQQQAEQQQEEEDEEEEAPVANASAPSPAATAAAPAPSAYYADVKKILWQKHIDPSAC